MPLSDTETEGLSDDELVARVRASDRTDLREFEQLMQRHAPRVAANCRHLSGSATDAEDLTQEVFVKAYFKLDRFEGRGSFGAWIGRIKVNHCLNHLKKTKRMRFDDIDDPVVASSDALHVAADGPGALERAVIHEVLEGLTDTLRIPLVMCDVDGFSYQEIAEQLGVGLSAVKMRIKRGREEFRRRYEEATGARA